MWNAFLRMHVSLRHQLVGLLIAFSVFYPQPNSAESSSRTVFTDEVTIIFYCSSNQHSLIGVNFKSARQQEIQICIDGHMFDEYVGKFSLISINQSINEERHNSDAVDKMSSGSTNLPRRISQPWVGLIREILPSVGGVWKLTLNKPEASDSGRYACIDNGGQGEQLLFTVINVVDRPRAVHTTSQKRTSRNVSQPPQILTHTVPQTTPGNVTTVHFAAETNGGNTTINYTPDSTVAVVIFVPVALFLLLLILSILICVLRRRRRLKKRSITSWRSGDARSQCRRR